MVVGGFAIQKDESVHIVITYTNKELLLFTSIVW